MYAIDLATCCTNIEAVTNSAHPHEVFEILARNPDWPFLPVTDDRGRPVGVVRERRLKEFAYSRFGRDLIQRRSLAEFLEPSLVVAADTRVDDLLSASASNPNPDGVVVTSGGVYHGVLLNGALLRLHEERHVETKVRLANAQKMEAIGTLAGGIAHDLNNMLTPIIGFGELLRTQLQQGLPASLDFVEQVLVSAQRASQTVKQILAFSRQQDAERCLTRVSHAIGEVMRLVRATLPSTIDIELAIETPDDLVLASPTELHQVLMNLCTNAFHAMRERGGRLLVRLALHEGPLLGWSMHAGPLPARLVRLSVSDSGIGVDPAVLPRIFEPFFTTKRQGEGTGMGLAIVHGIVSRAKGFVSVSSALGLGTACHVYLPLQVSPDACVNGVDCPPVTATPGPGQGLAERVLRVLIVDDETSITRLAATVFARHGWEVTTENDACLAWERFRATPDAFDALLTDQMMPDLTGLDLARRVLALRPGLPVMLCTGFAEAATPDECRALGIRERVLKPLDFAHAAALLRRHCGVGELAAA